MPWAPRKQLGGGAGGGEGVVHSAGLRAALWARPRAQAANVSPGDAAAGGERGAAAAATVRTAVSEKTRVSDPALNKEGTASSVRPARGLAGPRRPGGCRGRAP